tara:strand:+ start:549 stop:875 length:327 start_codon:yes stop_codon:yes gene_type:complete
MYKVNKNNLGLVSGVNLVNYGLVKIIKKLNLKNVVGEVVISVCEGGRNGEEVWGERVEKLDDKGNFNVINNKKGEFLYNGFENVYNCNVLFVGLSECSGRYYYKVRGG